MKNSSPKKLSADRKPAVGRVSANCWQTVVYLLKRNFSANCRLTVGRMSVIVQPYGVKKILNCALWGKSIKLGTVIVLVVLISFSYGPHSNMREGRLWRTIPAKIHGLYFKLLI